MDSGTEMSRTGSDRINGERINGLFHLLINGVYGGYNPLILTIDPFTSWDIQVLNYLLHPFWGMKSMKFFRISEAKVPIFGTWNQIPCPVAPKKGRQPKSSKGSTFHLAMSP